MMQQRNKERKEKCVNLAITKNKNNHPLHRQAV